MLADGREPPVAHSIVYDLPAESGFSAPMIDTHTGRTVVVLHDKKRKDKEKQPNHYYMVTGATPGLPDTPRPVILKKAFAWVLRQSLQV